MAVAEAPEAQTAKWSAIIRLEKLLPANQSRRHNILKSRPITGIALVPNRASQLLVSSVNCPTETTAGRYSAAGGVSGQRISRAILSAIS